MRAQSGKEELALRSKFPTSGLEDKTGLDGQGSDREDPNEGVEDKTLREPKHNQLVWQVYSRGRKRVHVEKGERTNWKSKNRFSYLKKGGGRCVRQVGSGREKGAETLGCVPS